MFRNHVKRDLSAYCNGELDQWKSQRIAEHLLACQKCRREYEQIREGVRLAGELTSLNAPDDIWTGIEAQIEADTTVAQDGILRAPSKDVAETGRPSANRRSGSTFRWGLRAAGAAAGFIVVIAAGMLVYIRQRPQAAWAIEVVEGEPRVGSKPVGKEGKLYVGQWLETDQSSRVTLYPGPIGEVKVEPGSRIRVTGASQEQYRLSLERGEVQAKISAPPRLFFVDTPSAEAIDLGCAYTLDVDNSGAGSLHVTSGWVELVLKDRLKSLIPADAACLMRRGVGPGTPYFEDAPAALKSALEQFDFGGAVEGAGPRPLDVILREARKRDSLTLWHLLVRVAPEERGRVYDRLSELVPPPEGTSKLKIMQLDQAALDEWWLDVQRAWFD
jgi:hypothetical protein